MSHNIITNIAKQVPTTVDELSELGLADAIEKEYGERLVKNVNAFVEMNNLHKYIEQKRKNSQASSKRQKIHKTPTQNVSKHAMASNVVDMTDDCDKYNNGIDFNTFKLPAIANQAPAVATLPKVSAHNTSSYFNDAAKRAMAAYRQTSNK